MEKPGLAKTLSVTEEVELGNLLADADRLISADTDSGRQKAETLLETVIDRVGTDAKAAALSARAHLLAPMWLLIRAEYKRLTGESMAAILRMRSLHWVKLKNHSMIKP